MNLPSYYLSFAQQMGIDVADIVRLDKFKFINKDFPLASILIHESPFNKIRVGRDGDGGYVIAEGLTYDCLISAGVNDDDSFEQDFLSLNDVPAYAFDGSIEKMPTKDRRIKFYSKNISDKNSKKEDNLSNLLKDYDDIFLKMDIEGDEYIWLNSLDDDQLSKFKQIAIEFHEPYERYKWRCLERLSSSHWAVHFNPNNCGSVCYHVNDEVSTRVAECFEMTYIRKADIKGEPNLNKSTFPTKLDKPNDPNRRVINYQGFPYSI